MRKIGKKTREWLEAKPKLIKIYKAKKITRCEVSGSRFALSFHHILKRSSQKAEHTFEGTRLLSQPWHDFCEYDQEANDTLIKKPRGFNRKYFEKFKRLKMAKKKTKKAIWQQEHKCKNCRAITRQYICHSCGKVSIK